jgi:flavin reductase (DIM6/NTAB) family NADH-FMN oxidoreductase RutF
VGEPDLGGFGLRADPPVAIVTTFDGSERSGCLVGFYSQCSIGPARSMVWLSKSNHTFAVAERSRILAVHLVPESQLPLARLFGEESGDWTDKFARCSWRDGPDGVPLLDDCPDRLVGRVLEHHDPGTDHVGHLLEPILVETGGDGRVLRLRDVDHLDAGHDA